MTGMTWRERWCQMIHRKWFAPLTFNDHVVGGYCLRCRPKLSGYLPGDTVRFASPREGWTLRGAVHKT